MTVDTRDDIPAVKPSRRTRWLIWLTAGLAAALVLVTAFTIVLLSWHIQTSDTQWCTFYAGVTHDRAAVSPAFYHELTQLRGVFGCK